MGRRVCVGSRLDVSGRSGRSCERERQVVRVCGRRGEGLSSQNTCENMRVERTCHNTVRCGSAVLCCF